MNLELQVPSSDDELPSDGSTDSKVERANSRSGYAKGEIDFLIPPDIDAFSTAESALLSFDPSKLGTSDKGTASFLLASLVLLDHVVMVAHLYEIVNQPLSGLIGSCGEYPVVQSPNGRRTAYLGPVTAWTVEHLTSIEKKIGQLICGEPASSYNPRRVWNEAVRCLTHLDANLGVVPENLRDLRRIQRAWSKYSLEGVVVSHLDGSVESQSLPLHVHSRSPGKVERVSLRSGVLTASATDTRSCVIRQNDIDVEELDRALTSVEQLVGEGDINELRRLSTVSAFEGVPIAAAALDWVITQQQMNWKAVPKLSPGVRGDFSRKILCSLVEHFGTAEPHSVSADEFEAQFTEIILTFFEPAHHSYAHIAFREVHGKFSCYEPVDWRLIPGARRSAVTVSAEFLFENEFRAVLDHIKVSADKGESAGEPSSLDCGQVALLLGYYLGFRRFEILSLRMCDFEQIGPCMISFRGRGKSQGARRSLPAADLMPERDLRILTGFHGNRRCAGATNLDPLLPVGKAAADRLFAEVTYMLRTVTGNDRFRFHHLRHTFATRLFAEPYRSLPDVHGSPLARFLGTRPVSGGLGAMLADVGRARAWAWQVSELMGHISPAVTLQHYVHCIPEVTALTLSGLPRFVSVEHAAALVGRSSRTIRRNYRAQIRNGLMPISALGTPWGTSWGRSN